jgi:Transcriptional activator, adenine-specific DNA methyltransferase
MKIDIFNTDKKYEIIYTDPPWPQKKGNVRKCRPNQGKELDYATLPISEIEKIHNDFFLKNTAKKHNVFMWTIDKYLIQTERFMNNLGYTLHARIIWDKENGIAPAFTVRFSHEYLLWFYKKGKMILPIAESRGKQTTVIRERATRHSKKPVAAYQMLESMFPYNSKIELFARQQAENWDCWGDEV